MWLARTALALATTLGVLQGIPVGEEQSAVPPDAMLLTTNAKHDLRELAQEVLKSQPGNGPVIAPAVRNAIVAALEAEGIEVGGESTTEQYGQVASIDVIAPEGHSDLLAVVIELTIPCGSDAALFIFRNDVGRVLQPVGTGQRTRPTSADSAWRLVYEREEDDYESIAGALGSFNWKVSPPDAEGRFLVVTSSISPWCSSAWHRLRYQVDRVEPRRNEPVAIDRGELTSHEWDVELGATADSYSIQFNGSSFDPGILVRTYELHYVVDGDRPVRVDPIAGSPRDFVEEVLSMPRETAARWIDVDPDVVAESLPDDDGFNEFGETVHCDDDVWEVRVDHYTGPGFETFVSTWFIVTEANGAYRLREVVIPSGVEGPVREVAR
jgi:hypothetical protein